MQVFIKNSDDLKEIRHLKNDFMQTGIPDLNCACAFKPETGFHGCIPSADAFALFSAQRRRQRLSAIDCLLRQ